MRSASRHLSSAESGLRFGICAASGWRQIFAMKGQSAGGGVRKPRKQPSEGLPCPLVPYPRLKQGRPLYGPESGLCGRVWIEGETGGGGFSGDGKIKTAPCAVGPHRAVSYQRTDIPASFARYRQNYPVSGSGRGRRRGPGSGAVSPVRPSDQVGV